MQKMTLRPANEGMPKRNPSNEKGTYKERYRKEGGQQQRQSQGSIITRWKLFI